MLDVIYARCLKYALYAKCYYAECRYAECRGAVYVDIWKLIEIAVLIEIKVIVIFIFLMLKVLLG